MASYIQSTSITTKSVVVALHDNVSIDIGGNYYPLDFVNNGGPTRLTANNNILTIENLQATLGAASASTLLVNGVLKNVIIHIHEVTGVSRMITWSVY